MAKAAPVPCVLSIGEAAGLVWKLLSTNGPMTVAKLVKAADQPRDTVMQAIGWLAREDKLNITDERRGRVISLR
jgi:hypothetical protein